MAKTVLNVKTDIEVKEQAQKLAKRIGVPLSVIVNAQLKKFISDGKVEFSAHVLQPLTIDEIRRKAEPVFKKYGILKAQIFGSYARGEASADSDIDLMVTYGKKQALGAWEVIGIRQELADALNREVDLVTEGNVIPYFQESIYRDLKPLYEG